MLHDTTRWIHPFLIIVFYGVPNNRVCSNEVFNDISLQYSPVIDHMGTQKKYNKELDYNIKLGTNETYLDGQDKIAVGIVYEMEIVTGDNFQIEKNETAEKSLTKQFKLIIN